MIDKKREWTRRGLSWRILTTCSQIPQLPNQPFQSDFISNFFKLLWKKRERERGFLVRNYEQYCLSWSRKTVIIKWNCVPESVSWASLKHSLVIVMVLIWFIWDGAWDSGFSWGLPDVASWDGFMRHCLVLEFEVSYSNWLAVAYFSKFLWVNSL